MGVGIWDAVLVSASEAPLLADVAEAVGGWRVNVDEGLVPYGHAEARRFLTALSQRVRASDTPPRSLEAILLWFVTDPMERPISPLSAMMPEEYLRRMLTVGAGNQAAARQHFLGHPLLRLEADARTAADRAVKLLAVDTAALISSKPLLEQVVDAYSQAAKSDKALATLQRTVKAEKWNKLCWEGALRGHAKQSSLPATQL